MPPKMVWLVHVVRLAIVPVVLGALILVVAPSRSGGDVTAAAGLALLGGIHLQYWWRPWPARPLRSIAAASGMILTNYVLVYLLGLSQPLLWLYPALIVGAGLRPPVAALGVGLMALAAVAPLDLAGALVERTFGFDHSVLLTGSSGSNESTLLARTLGPSHSVFLAIVLAGLGMTAVRQLIALNLEVSATRAELAELAVAGERERLARELHDLLGRTLALIGVKAELASRLSAAGAPLAAAEMRDVQQLARHAVRDVRAVVAGDRAPSLAAELAAARSALRMADIEVCVTSSVNAVDPAHETTVAWALREAVTNVVKHSGARTCHIALAAADGITTLEVTDDGRGPGGGARGTGLAGIADRVQALHGTFDVGIGAAGGFRLWLRLGDVASTSLSAGVPR